VASINNYGQSAFNGIIFHAGGFNSQFNLNATGWYEQPGANWYVNSDSLYSYGEDGEWSTVCYYGTFTNFDYSARVKRDGGIYDDGEYYWAPANTIFVRMGGRFYGDNGWYPGYAFTYYDFQDSGFATYTIWRTSSDGNFKRLKYASTTYIANGDWNTLRVTASGSSFHFYINNHLVYTLTDSTFKSGSVGVGMYDMSGGDSTTYSVDWAILGPYGGAPISESISAEQQSLNDAGTNISSDQNSMEKDKHAK
jgi:hypothetical protein